MATKRAHRAGYILGFALGGFFDGILLHQILQWHHLLSAVDPDNARFQVAADGYFHLLMYGIAAGGLWLLWRSARGRELPSTAAFIADLLIGFGTWHVADSIASHWLLGIHRIRMDSEQRLFWDLVWFTVFGVLPLVAGLFIRRGGGDAKGGRAAIAAFVALLVVGSGAQALRPPADMPFTTILFAPGTERAQIFAAIDAVGGELVWSDTSGELVVITRAPGASALRLFARGAIFISTAGFPAGCFSYLRST